MESKNFLKNAANAALATLTALVAAASFSGFGYFGDLAAHFMPAYGAAALLAGLGFAVARDVRAFVVAAVLAIICGLQVVPEFRRDKMPPATAGTKLKIVFANVSSHNHDASRILRWISERDPDVIGVIEVNQAWREALVPALKSYHVQGVWAQQGSFGLALFSKTPFLETSVMDFGPTGLPSLVARLPLHPAPLTLVLTHAYPPLQRELFRERNLHLADLGAFLSRRALPFVALGDLNDTPFSRYFKQLLQISHAHDSRRGFGFQASWPVNRYIPAILPIDHALLSENIRAERREIGPDIGSDHYPVYMEICIE